MGTQLPDPVGKFIIGIFCSLFLLVGVITVVSTTTRVLRNYNLEHTGIRGTGHVIDFKVSRGKNPKSSPVVTFVTPEGKSVIFESLSDSPIGGYSVGQQVRIIYDRNNPGSAEINETDRLWDGISFSYFVAVVFILFSGGLLRWGILGGKR